jgi:hypothetical protein
LKRPWLKSRGGGRRPLDVAGPAVLQVGVVALVEGLGGHDLAAQLQVLLEGVVGAAGDENQE